MKTQLLQMLIFLLVVNVTTASQPIVISHVLYDPINSESGGEAVRLHNPSTSPIDISGWKIVTETSQSDATIPENTIINGGSYYLIADVGWSTGKDDSSWPNADHEEALTLSNTDAGVGISNGSFIIDAVGWGDANNIGPGLFEGTPHDGVDSGQILQRISDLGNNTIDFVIGDFELFDNGEIGVFAINVMATVEGAYPEIESLTITSDDSSEEGIQITPIPLQNKSIIFTSQVRHDSGLSQIQSIVAILGNRSRNILTINEINQTSGIINSSINLSFTDTPGNYTLQLIITDKQGLSAVKNTSLTYSGLIAVSLDQSDLTFSSLPGKSSESSLTIHNIGNTIVDIQLASTDLTTPSNNISSNKMDFTFNGDYDSSLSGTMSSNMQTMSTSLLSDNKLPLTFRLNIPQGTGPGNYTGMISLVAIKS